MKAYLIKANSILEEVIKHRRFLHENAEVGFGVKRTTEYIYGVLQGYGIPAKKLKKGGVVAEIKAKRGDRDGFILLRADVDGLNLEEESDLPYACKSGRMHACGHDLHAAALLGAAKLLKDMPLKKSVRLLFQPAEEILEGGKYALSQGVAEGVDCAFALHVASGVDLPVGSILLPNSGVSSPSADTFEIATKGESCHGATPQDGVDALIVSSAILQGLQTLIAREVPIGEGLLTVGRLESGGSPNVIAGKVVLQGSMRAFDEKWRGFIKGRIQQMAKGIASAYRAKASVRFFGGCPALLQDENLLKIGEKVWKKAFGKGNILSPKTAVKQIGPSEDFAYLSQVVPSLLISVVASQKGGGYPLHHPKVVFDEKALSFCVAAHLSFALEVGVGV